MDGLVQKRMTVQTCGACGGAVRASVLPVYDLDLGGVRARLFDAVVRETCDACGEAVIEVPDLDGLARTAAMLRMLVPLRLIGGEIRFLRRALDMSGREFAEAMELTPETVSRWENGGRGIGGDTEKLLRHNVCALLHKEVSAIAYDPADITRLRIQYAPEDFVLPPLELRRVAVKTGSGVEDAWDRAALVEALG